MTIRTRPNHIFLGLIFFVTCYSLHAEVIDPFTAAQGPFTVGVDETISEEEAVVMSPGILGGFRVALPGVGDDAGAGSEVTLGIGGGMFTCEISFTTVDTVNNYSGCSTGYGSAESEVFNLSGSSQFEIDITSVQGGLHLAISVIDDDEEIDLFLVQNVTPGLLVVPFTQLLPTTSLTGADLSKVDVITLTITNAEGDEGSISIADFSTDGPITIGAGSPSDNVESEEIPGSYYNSNRDGEGCQLTREGDEVTFILTCYFYKDGEQFWLIGSGTLVGGQIVIANMTITSGADFGPDFDPDDVVRDTWGAAFLTWDDCNNLELELLPVLQGFEQVTLELTRVVPVTCGAGRPQAYGVPGMGTFFDPLRDGEGFQLGAEGDGSVFVMTWYTYLDGEQVWLIGVGTRNGNQIVFDEMILTSGADFGSAFDPDDVVREVFGQIVLDFDDCNNATATVDSVLPQFSDIVLDVTKVVPGMCP
jgi:hypothetical protein